MFVYIHVTKSINIFNCFWFRSAANFNYFDILQKYIEPIFLRRHKDQEEKLERMEKGIAELNSGVNKNLQVPFQYSSLFLNLL